MKEVGIPGSKFQICLEDNQDQWFLRLRINGAVEEELPLAHLEQKNFKNNIIEILELAHLNLNDIQIGMIHKDLWEYVEMKLQRGKSEKKQFGTIEDPRFEELIDRIEKLTEQISKLDARVSNQEMKLT